MVLVDVDSERTSPKISATAEELEAALELARRIRDYLCQVRHWPGPIVAMSGNGAHLLFRIDLLNDGHAKQTVADVLAALDIKFSGDEARVDTSVFNASRICKLPGTLACKGDSTTDRPHRRSHIVKQPEVLEVVTEEQLEALAALAPQVEASPAGNGSGRFDVKAFLDRHSIAVRREKPGRDRTIYELTRSGGPDKPAKK